MSEGEAKTLGDRIASMTVFHVRMPVTTVRSHGSGDVAGASEHVILRLETQGGLIGWGEAAPWVLFTGSPEASFAALDRYLRPVVVGANPFAIGAIMAMADHNIVGHPEAKAALETALLDLAGQAVGAPIYALLGGKCRDRIPLSFSVANPDFDADIAMISALYEDGHRLFKVKTGFADHAFDLMRLERMRSAFPELALRIDYNQGLKAHEAHRVLADLEAFTPDFVEQPVPRDQRDVMASLAASFSTPLLADESVFSPEDALIAVRERICDLISVKIMKTGGLRRAQVVAGIAEAAGMACYGGDMFETGIAHLAGTHLIAATPNISLGCEFYQARWYLKEDVLVEPFPVEHGMVIVPDAPGLGIAVDEGRVRYHAIAVSGEVVA